MKSEQFNAEVAAQQRNLMHFAMHFAHNEEDARDLVQDTILKAITNYDKFQQGTNLNAWLYTILRNTFINYYRKGNSVKNLVKTCEDVSSADLYYSARVIEGLRSFVRGDTQKALNHLPEEYYQPFMMYFEGYKYYEIAAYLQVPIGTVKTRIHLARKTLKKALKPYTLEKQPHLLAAMEF